MRKLTAFVLRHKLAVVLAWVVIALAGALSAGTTVNRLAASFSLPGQPG